MPSGFNHISFTNSCERRFEIENASLLSVGKRTRVKAVGLRIIADFCDASHDAVTKSGEGAFKSLLQAFRAPIDMWKP